MCGPEVSDLGDLNEDQPLCHGPHKRAVREDNMKMGKPRTDDGWGGWGGKEKEREREGGQEGKEVGFE